MTNETEAELEPVAWMYEQEVANAPGCWTKRLSDYKPKQADDVRNIRPLKFANEAPAPVGEVGDLVERLKFVIDGPADRRFHLTNYDLNRCIQTLSQPARGVSDAMVEAFAGAYFEEKIDMCDARGREYIRKALEAALAQPAADDWSDDHAGSEVEASPSRAEILALLNDWARRDHVQLKVGELHSEEWRLARVILTAFIRDVRNLPAPGSE